MNHQAASNAYGDRLDAPFASPRPVLAIGVTGHRDGRLEGVDLAALTDTIAATLHAIEQVAQGVAPVVELRAITALADGADSLVAMAAQQRGWTLFSVLPFARKTYADDFATAETQATFDALIAASARVFEIAGDARSAAAPAAYERAGRIVLAQSDILIAVWDGEPALGRGGTGHIVAEAVARDIPVIRIDPRGAAEPMLLWDGLTEHDLGQQDIETVPRGSLDGLPGLIAQLIEPPGDAVSRAMIAAFAALQPRGTLLAMAYPLLLALAGVQRPALRHVRAPDRAASAASLRACFAPVAPRARGFAAQLESVLLPVFVQADTIASQTAQMFRSGYVANFTLSALAVILTLLSLALPISAKPVLVLLELMTITTVLVLTHTGNRLGWHRRWLDNRNLAEGCRCLALAAQIGLGAGSGRSEPAASPAWVRHVLRQTARAIALPDAVADQGYLGDVRAGLVRMIDAQIGYLARESRRMHHLEHRLHLAGTALFAATALACIVAMAIEAGLALAHRELSEATMHVFLVGMTMITAGLPALGAAIYGIRMQGEFASLAERAHDTHDRLRVLRHTIDEDELAFDTLQRRIAHLTALLTSDLSDWHRTYHARPLALPG
jgi:hypothetical protein